jgi:hypothetical protein
VPASGARTRPVAPAAAPRGTRCTIVLWRDVPSRPDLEKAVARQTQCAVAAVHAAGGRDYDEGSLDWASVAGGSNPVVVVAEGWEAPDKAVLRLMRDLRRALGPRRHLAVLLAQVGAGGIGPSLAAEVRVWEESLAPLEDPYLAVDALRGAA